MKIEPRSMRIDGRFYVHSTIEPFVAEAPVHPPAQTLADFAQRFARARITGRVRLQHAGLLQHALDRQLDAADVQGDAVLYQHVA